MSDRTQAKLHEMAASFPATVVVHKAAEGGFWVESPQFAGCFSSGDTVQDALHDFKLCLFDYFEIPKKSQKINALKYRSSEFPEPRTEEPQAMELTQSPGLLAV